MKKETFNEGWLYAPQSKKYMGTPEIPFEPVQKALYAISFYSRYHNLTLGIFKVSDLFFFISCAAVFFFLTTRVLEKRRWSGK